MKPLAALALLLAVTAALRLDVSPETIQRRLTEAAGIGRAMYAHARAWTSQAADPIEQGSAAPESARFAPLPFQFAVTGVPRPGTPLLGAPAVRRVCRVTVLQRSGVCGETGSGSVGSPNSMNFMPWKKIDAGYQSSFGVIVASPSRS